jgi:hypothetical protein
MSVIFSTPTHKSWSGIGSGGSMARYRLRGLPMAHSRHPLLRRAARTPSRTRAVRPRLRLLGFLLRARPGPLQLGASELPHSSTVDPMRGLSRGHARLGLSGPDCAKTLAGLQARSGPAISCFKIACFIGFDPNRGTAGLAPWRRLRPRLLFSSPRVCRGRGRLCGARRARGTTSRSAPPSRPKRRSARCRKAAARS